MSITLDESASQKPHWSDGLVTVALALVALLSTWSSFIGLQSLGLNTYYALFLAAVGGFAIFTFWTVFRRKFPEYSAKALIPIAIFAFAIFGMSTIWNMLAIGGDSGLRWQKEGIISTAESQAAEIYAQNQREYAGRSQALAFSEIYADLAKREANSGLVSGHVGTGAVLVSLQQRAQLLKQLATQMGTSSSNVETLHNEFLTKVNEARDAEPDDFTRDAAELRRQLSRMRNGLSYSFGQTLLSQLSSLSNVGRVESDADVAADQTEAMRNLTKTDEAVQKTLSSIFPREFANGGDQHETIAVVARLSAVFQYAWRMPGEWAFSVSPDWLFPFSVIAMYWLSASTRRRREEEEAAARRAAIPAPPTS